MENVGGKSLRNTKKRLPGIEALRLLSILFIVIFHVAIWNDVDAISGSAFLTVLGGIGVNAFAVITGFVYYSPDEKPLEPKKYLRLWTTVLFYSFGIMLLGKILTPGKVSTKDLAFSALPVTSSFWWYFSSYSALFFLQPMLSSMVRYMTVNRKYIYIAVFSVYPTVAGLIKDPFNLSWGYSTLWLCMMFVVGALLRKHDIASKINIKKSAVLLIATYLFIGIGASVIRVLSTMALGYSLGEQLFVDYTSPFVVLCSVLLVLLAARIKMPDAAARMVSIFAPAAFGVYIIHYHPYIANNLIKGKFLWIHHKVGVVTIVQSVLISLCIWAICLLVERLRITLLDRIKGFYKNIKVRK